jgi:hypothetical protein
MSKVDEAFAESRTDGKPWQDIIDRLKDAGDWEAAAALWDARQAATMTLTPSERLALREVAGNCADEDDAKSSEIAAVIHGLLDRTRMIRSGEQ